MFKYTKLLLLTLVSLSYAKLLSYTKRIHSLPGSITEFGPNKSTYKALRAFCITTIPHSLKHSYKYATHIHKYTSHIYECINNFNQEHEQPYIKLPDLAIIINHPRAPGHSHSHHVEDIVEEQEDILEHVQPKKSKKKSRKKTRAKSS